MKTRCLNLSLRFALLWFFVLFGQLLQAQNFQTVYPERTAHFATTLINGEFYDGFLDRCENYDQCLLGIRIDSIDANQPEVHYFPRYSRGGLSTSGEICAGPSWMGNKWIQKDFVEFYFNGEEDTIKIFPLADIGDQWNLFDLPSGYIEGEVTTIEMALVLENMDQVKSIRLQAKDDQGNPMTHPLNDQLILISENYGFVKTFDFYHFPNEPTPKELLGMTNPNLGQSLLPTPEINNLDIGLERHAYRECHNSTDLSYSQYTTKSIVLDSTHLGNTIKYELEQTLLYVYVQPMINQSDTTFSVDTIETTISIETNILDIQPLEWVPDHDPWGPLYMLIGQEEGRWKKIVRGDLDFEFPCMVLTTGQGGYIILQACLGQTDRIDVINGACEERLLYYKKGSETWGTPFDFDALTSTSALLDFKNHFEILPNPFTDRLSLRSKSGRALIRQYELVDLYGRSVLRQNVESSSAIVLDLPNLVSGIYLLKWMDQEGRSFLSKIIKE